MSAPQIVDYSLHADGPAEHIRNSLMLLGGLRRALQISGLEAEDAQAMVEAISVRLGKALAQLDERHEFGCTAYVGRPCICVALRKERVAELAQQLASRAPAARETQQ